MLSAFIKILDTSAKKHWRGGVLLFALAVFVPVIFPKPASAQTLSIGYKKYSRGDFRGAEFALTSALKNKKQNRKSIGTIYKYLGITQYMLKKTKSSQASFQRAIAYYPSTTISSKEVLDERILPFFNAIKSKMSKGRQKRRPTASQQSVVTKTTYLLIKSNVPSATLTVNGILAGNIGSLIESDPGVVVIQLSAPGFITKRAKLRVLPKRKNTYTINLTKPKPKPRPIVKAPTRQQRQKAQPKRSQAKGVYLPNPGEDLFGESSDPLPPAAAPMQRPQYQTPQPYAAPPQQPYMQQQPAYNPYGLAAPGYAQPAYPYPTQPYAPAPVYPQANPYAAPYSPPPVYAAPVAPPATPEPLPIPEMDGYKNSDSGFSDAPRKKSSRKKRRSSRTRKKSTKYKEPNILISLLPFGAGQFQADKNILGGAFLAAEAFALYWYWQNKNDADQAILDAQTFFERDDVTDAEKEQFESETASYVSSKRSQQDMGLYGFVGLWAAGVGEAILNAPTPPRKQKTSRRKSRRFLSDYTPTEDINQPHLGLRQPGLTATIEEKYRNQDLQDYRLYDENSDNHNIAPNYENSDNHSLGFDYSNPDIQAQDHSDEDMLNNSDDDEIDEDSLETLDPESDSENNEEFSHHYQPRPAKISVGLVYDEEAILKHKNINPYLGVKMSWGF